MKMVIDLTAEEKDMLSKELSPYFNREDTFDYCMGFIAKDKNGNVILKGVSIYKEHKNTSSSQEYNIRLDTNYFVKYGMNGIFEALDELGYRRRDEIVFK